MASHDVLLIAADLNERRLIYGELLEAGYTVMPAVGVAAAMGLLLGHRVVPRLIVIDIQGDPEASPQSVSYLTSLCPAVPSLVVVGAIERTIWEPVRASLAALLIRPINIGRIVERVKQILPLNPVR